MKTKKLIGRKKSRNKRKKYGGATNQSNVMTLMETLYKQCYTTEEINKLIQTKTIW